MEKIKKNLPLILLIIIISGGMFILNISTLKSPDDYSYAFSIAGDNLKIDSFSELFNSAKRLYNEWTGRIIPHLLIGVFMTTSTVFYKIINTVLFVILLIYISKFLNNKISYLSIVVAFGYFVYGKMFGEKFAWISGSLNYLWTNVFLIIYLYTIYGYFVENKKLKSWQKVAITLFGFIVGFLHEVVAFVGCSFLGVLFLANIKKWWKSSKSDKIFLVMAIIMFGLGSILTVIAPGNLVRSTMDVAENTSPLACLGNYRDIKWQLFITIISMVVVGILKQKELLKKEVIYFILPCIIATIPFSIMGYFPPRCFVPYEALIIIITVANIEVIVKHFEKNKKAIVVASSLITIIVFARFLPTIYSDIRYILPYKIKMTHQLEDAKKNGEKDVIISKFLFMDKIHREDLINIDNFFIETATSSVVNTYVAMYYGFDCLRAISDIDYLVEIETDITDTIDYGIVDKNTLELISIIPASDKICFTIPKEKLGTYVVDCRDKDLRSHVKSVKIRAVNEEIENPDIEVLINQAK